MRLSLVTPGLVLYTSLISSSSALLASTESPCASQCGNTLSSTSGADIVCSDDGYGTGLYGTSAGTVFANCVSCQLNSTYVDPTTHQSDLQFALYNLRYTLSYCVFGFPNNPSVPSTPCTTSFACGPMQSAWEFDSLSINATEYGFCPMVPSINIPKCQSCLQQETNEYYLSNFVVALNAACTQQPSPGSTLSLQGSVFSLTQTNITTPSATAQSTFTPRHGLSLGAIVGIALGGVLVLFMIAGVCIICIGRRRRRRAIAEHQRRTGYTNWLAEQQVSHTSPPQMSGPFFDSPVSAISQRPLVQTYPWANSPLKEDPSPVSAVDGPAYFSPYSSQYSSPISALEQAAVKGREWPIDRKGSFGGAGLERNRSIEKRFFPEDQGDRIELQNVAPVLNHPKNGRGTPPGLTEEDVRKGNAL